LERLELRRAADAGARASRRAGPGGAQHPPLGRQRAEGVRARLPLPARALRRALRSGPAAQRRADHERLPAPSGGAGGGLHVHDFSPTALVIVDEAWGGHLHFHPDLPPSAMASGADLCVQSTHKLAGGLQQTGLIHWHAERVDSELMEEAYREYVTTSPSYHLLASCDAAVRALASDGEAALGACIERTRAF